MIIRKASVFDVWLLSELYRGRGEEDRKFFHPFPNGLVSSELTFVLILLVTPLTWFTRSVFPKGSLHFIVAPSTDGRSLDGFAYLRLRRRVGLSYVANLGLMVRNSSKGRGVGTRLLSVLMQDARRMGVRSFEITSHPANRAALNLYMQLGFRVAPRPFYHGQRVIVAGDEIPLVLRLDDT